MTALFQYIKSRQEVSNEGENFLNYNELSDFMTTLGAIFENENEKNAVKNEKLIDDFFSFDNPFDNHENDEKNNENENQNFENENKNENENENFINIDTPEVTPVGTDNLNSSLIDFSEDVVEVKNEVKEVRITYVIT